MALSPEMRHSGPQMTSSKGAWLVLGIENDRTQSVVQYQPIDDFRPRPNRKKCYFPGTIDNVMLDGYSFE